MSIGNAELKKSCFFLDKAGFKSIRVLLIDQSSNQGAQWLSGRVLDSRPRGRRIEPNRRHWVVVLEQDTFILA